MAAQHLSDEIKHKEFCVKEFSNVLDKVLRGEVAGRTGRCDADLSIAASQGNEYVMSRCWRRDSSHCFARQATPILDCSHRRRGGVRERAAEVAVAAVAPGVSAVHTASTSAFAALRREARAGFIALISLCRQCVEKVPHGQICHVF